MSHLAQEAVCSSPGTTGALAEVLLACCACPGVCPDAESDEVPSRRKAPLTYMNSFICSTSCQPCLRQQAEMPGAACERKLSLRTQHTSEPPCLAQGFPQVARSGNGVCIQGTTRTASWILPFAAQAAAGALNVAAARAPGVRLHLQSATKRWAGPSSSPACSIQL